MDAFFSAFCARATHLEPTAEPEPLIHTTLRSYTSVPLKATPA
ncbi:hypothetical protein [Brevibacterium otitidis]|uniref:Uncharacterized protein n=1 Tax=Brevibacterium otitidis TaxID=53364 RepID=A0ABV5X050_9MICO